MNESKKIIDACFEASKNVRYVAVYTDGNLVMRSREDLAGASSSESDKYEELLVNPTLLMLTSQRGNIDCGGFKFLLVRYGNFFQFVYPLNGGHVSVALEPTVDLIAIPELLIRIIEERK